MITNIKCDSECNFGSLKQEQYEPISAILPLSVFFAVEYPLIPIS